MTSLICFQSFSLILTCADKKHIMIDVINFKFTILALSLPYPLSDSLILPYPFLSSYPDMRRYETYYDWRHQYQIYYPSLIRIKISLSPLILSYPLILTCADEKYIINDVINFRYLILTVSLPYPYVDIIIPPYPLLSSYPKKQRWKTYHKWRH